MSFDTNLRAIAWSISTLSAVTEFAPKIVLVTEPASKLAVLSLSIIADLMTALSIKVSPVM